MGGFRRDMSEPYVGQSPQLSTPTSSLLLESKRHALDSEPAMIPKTYHSIALRILTTLLIIITRSEHNAINHVTLENVSAQPIAAAIDTMTLFSDPQETRIRLT